MSFFDNSTVTMSFLKELTPDELRKLVNELDHLADYHTVVTLAQDIYGKEDPEHIYVSFEGDSDDEGGMNYHVSSWSVENADRETCKPDLEAPFWHRPSVGWSKTTPLEDLEEKLKEQEQESYTKDRNDREYARQQAQRARLQEQWHKDEEQKKQEYAQATNNRYTPYYSSFSTPFWTPPQQVPLFGRSPEETNHLYEAKRIELRESKDIEWPEIPLQPEPEGCPLYADDTTREEALREIAEELMDDDYWDLRSEQLSNLDEDRDEYTVSQPPKVSFEKVFAMIPTNDPEEASVKTQTIKLDTPPKAEWKFGIPEFNVTAPFMPASMMNQVRSEPIGPEALINYLSNAWGGEDATDWQNDTSHVAFGNWMAACLFMRLCFPSEARSISVYVEDTSESDDEGGYTDGRLTLDRIVVSDKNGKQLDPDRAKPLCKYLLAQHPNKYKTPMMDTNAIVSEMLNDNHLPITVPLVAGHYDITEAPIPVFPKLLVP